MKSSSIFLIQDVGISDPRGYRDRLIHDWTLTEHDSKHLDLYLLRNIETREFFLRFEEGEFLFARREYSVTWLRHPSFLRNEEIATISLRYCSYLKRGYCLIREHDPNREQHIEFISLFPHS